MPMWYIVQLVNDEEMYIIPGFWMKDDKTTTAWPSYCSSFEDVQTSIKDREKPKSDWTSRNIAKILKTSVTYNSASNWIKEQIKTCIRYRRLTLTALILIMTLA